MYFHFKLNFQNPLNDTLDAFLVLLKVFFFLVYYNVYFVPVFFWIINWSRFYGFCPKFFQFSHPFYHAIFFICSVSVSYLARNLYIHPSRWYWFGMSISNSVIFFNCSLILKIRLFSLQQFVSNLYIPAFH